MFGDNLKFMRESKRLKQEEVSEKTGISVTTLSRYENNRRTPQLSDLISIADALSCSVSELLGENEYTQHTVGFGNLRSVDIVSVPVVSPEMTACCGCGIGALDVTSEPSEFVGFAKSDLGNSFDDLRKPFAIRADGDSMKGYGIPNGCIVAINPAEPVASLDIALVSYFGKLALKKICFMPDNSVDLLSSDGDKIHIPSDDNIPELFCVLGKAMATSCRINHGI